jgi:hypothetical protein
MLKHWSIIAAAVLVAVCSVAVNAQEYCEEIPGEGYPPEADVTITIGTPCDSTEILSIPVYLDNPCPVSGFQIDIVLTEPDAGVYFDPEDPNAADTIGSRNTGWAFFTFNVLDDEEDYPTTLRVTAIGPGGEQPLLPPGDGLLFTVHPQADGPIHDCQTVRFGATDFVIGESGYYSYGATHINGTLCVGCDEAWLRGDANRSGTRNIADVIALYAHLKGIDYLCFGSCLCTGDFNNSGVVNIADVIDMYAFLKTGGDPPDPCP